MDVKTDSLCVWVSLWQCFLRAALSYTQLGWQGEAGQPGIAGENTGTCGAERSGPYAEERAYDSLLYPLAVGGHFIQCILHTDAHVLNGIKLVHEALSLRVLQEDR